MDRCMNIEHGAARRGPPDGRQTVALPGELVVDGDGRIVTTFRYAYCEHWIEPRNAARHIADIGWPSARSSVSKSCSD